MSEVQVRVKIQPSEQQVEVILDYLMYDHELYILKDEFIHIRKKVVEALERDGRFLLNRIVKAELVEHEMIWVCICEVRDKTHEKDQNQNEHVHNPATEGEEC